MYSQKSNSETVVNFIHRRKINLRSVFHSKCCLCGFDEVQEALEFHHVNPKEKSFAIMGGSNQTKALNLQLEEMQKCILVCANCHRGIHNGVYDVPKNWTEFYDKEVANKLLNELQLTKTKNYNYCQNCGKIITKKAKYCVDCNCINQRKVERPSKEELKTMIRHMPFTQIAQQYNVTDNTIRKWCKGYNLPCKKKDIRQVTDQEWKKI